VLFEVSYLSDDASRKSGLDVQSKQNFLKQAFDHKYFPKIGK
jgi:hypothetical protein